MVCTRDQKALFRAAIARREVRGGRHERKEERGREEEGLGKKQELMECMGRELEREEEA